MKKRIKIFEYELTWSQIITFIITSILLGFLAKVGEDGYAYFKTINKNDINNVIRWVVNILFSKIKINLFTLILIIIIGIPLFKFLYLKVFIKIISERIFFENFSTTKHSWNLDFWGDANSQGTNRIENNEMVFEALLGQWSRGKGEGVAFYDLTNGVIEGLTYEVSCKAKSTDNTTMGFRLWVHDTNGNNSKTNPQNFVTPPSNNAAEYKLLFKATKTNAIRIHLLCREGEGSIIAKEVSVKKFNYFKSK